MLTRNTIQRTLVYETVCKLHNHATAEEVYAEVSREHPGVSRGTVYRNLNCLAEDGKIRKIDIPCGADRFDDRCDNHYHVKCEKCGKVFDVDMDYIADINTKIKDAHGFEYTGYDIVFKGICPDCQRK